MSEQTDRDFPGRVADGWYSAFPFAVMLIVTFILGLRNSDLLAAQMAVLFWTTSDHRRWL